VEQKNGAVVRRLVGYGRLSGVDARNARAQLYASSRLYITKPKQSNRTCVTPRNGLTDDETWIGPKPEFSATSAELLEHAA
jgi:hypothetical protein